MRDTSGMRVGNRVADPTQNADEAVQGPSVRAGLPAAVARGEMDFPDDVQQGASANLLHGEIAASVGGGAQLMNGNDARVL